MLNRHLGRAAYLIGSTLIAIPLWDSITSLYPFKLTDSHWRFGSVGLLSNAMMIPLQGLFFIIVAATLLEHFRMLKIVGVLSFVGAGACLLVLAGFSLDALQSANDLKAGMELAFRFASITAGSKLFLAGAAMLLLGTAAWKGGEGGTQIRSSLIAPTSAADLARKAPSKLIPTKDR